MFSSLKLLFFLQVLGFVAASPLARRAFTLQQYNQFQISDGVGGTAQKQADAIFVTPFAGVDLTTVSATDLKNLNTMREAAEGAETDEFDPQISAASGAAAAALKVGKIKNKVLKLTAEVQSIQIKIAQQKAKGQSTSATESSLTVEQGKLANNIKLDAASAGEASKGVTV